MGAFAERLEGAQDRVGGLGEGRRFGRFEIGEGEGREAV